MASTRGAIILCGGQSSRMGRDKASLPCGSGELLMQRVVRLVAEVVPYDRIICVAAPQQLVPRLPAQVEIVRDSHPHQGPLAGLATGLNAVSNRAAAVFVCGCDALLLVPAVVERMFELIGGAQVVAVNDGERTHPLVAVYRANVLPIAQSLLVAGKQSLASLLDQCDTLRIPIDELRNVDPQLDSFRSCNTPDEYERMLGRRLTQDRRRVAPNE